MRFRPGFLIVTVIFLAVTAPAFAWRFISFADSRGDTNGVNTTAMSAIVSLINQENADLAIFQGDAVTGSGTDSTLGSMMDNWVSYMNTLNCRWYYTPGNHEISTTTQEALIRTKVDMPLNGPSGYEETVFSVDHRTAHFVALNSDHYNEQHHVQRTWLTTDLANTRQPHLYVMAHEPAYPTASHIGSSLDVYPSERDNLWSIMSGKGVETFFCGHEHLFEKSMHGTICQCLNGTCGAPLVTGEPGTVANYHYVVVDVDGYSAHYVAKNDSGAVIGTWDLTAVSPTPAVKTPAPGAVVSTLTPTIAWDSPAHDMYQVKVSQVNDPNVMLNGWDSGQVTSAANTATCETLNDFSQYYIFVRVRSGGVWGQWSTPGWDFVVNRSPGTVAIHTGDYRPSTSGWTVYGSNSHENGNGVRGVVVPDGGSYAWKLFEGDLSGVCTMKYPLTGVSFDTGATVEARIRLASVNGSTTRNFGISKTGVGGMFVAVWPNVVTLVDVNGAVMGSAYANTATYHKYRLTVKNGIPGNNASATWRVYVDGIQKIVWFGAGFGETYDGLMMGHAGVASNGDWYFDWVAGRSDGDFSPSQWSPVVPLDSTPPGPLTSFAATPGDARVNLSWTNPMDGSYVGTTIRYRTDTYPSSATDGTSVCNRTAAPGSSDNFTHTGLTNGVTYYYAAFAYDGIPSYSVASNAAVVPNVPTISVRPAGAITVDGNSADWNLSDFVTPAKGGRGGVGDYALVGFDGGSLYYGGYDAAASLPTSAADHTAKVYSRQGGGNLYFLVRCDDSDIRTPNGVAANLDNDAVEFCIDANNNHGSVPLSNSTSDIRLVIDAANQKNVYSCTDSYKNQILAGVSSSVTTDANGWWLEVAIQQSALDPDLPGSGKFGVDFILRDNDGDSSDNTIYSWRDVPSGGFPSNVPDNWGDAVIVDITAPGQIAGFAATASAMGNRLSWTNPADADFAGVAIVCKTTGYPTSRTDGVILGDEAGTPAASDGMVHSAVDQGVTYYYCAYAHDGDGNYAAPAQASSTPLCLAVWLNEGFDIYANGSLSGAGLWTAAAAASGQVESSFVSNSVGKSVVLDPPAAGGISVANQISVNPRTGGYYYATVEVAQDAAGTTGQLAGYVAFYASDSATEIAKLHIQKGRIFLEYGTGLLATISSSVSNLTWYTVKIGFNIDTKKMDAWLGPTQKVTNYSWKGTGTNLSRIVACSDNNANLSPQRVYLDNLRIEKKPVAAAAVRDDGAWTPSLSKLHFSFDADACVGEYRYAIGTTPSGTTVRNWTSCGTASDILATGLSLPENQLLYVQLQTGTGLGNWSPSVATDGIRVAPGLAGIPAAEALPDSSTVYALRGKVVSAEFPGCFYIQEPADPFGIKVVSAADVNPGDAVDAAGFLGGSAAERFLDCTGNGVIVSSPGPGAPEPVVLTNAAVGGVAEGLYIAGVYGGVSPNNVGLLVTTCGKITAAGAGFFYIDDGSGVTDTRTDPATSQPYVGIKALDSSHSPIVGEYWTVTGVSTVESDGSNLIRVIKSQQATNLQ